MLYSFTLTLLLIMTLAACVPQTVNVPAAAGTPVRSIPVEYSSGTPAPLITPKTPSLSTLMPDLVVFYSYLEIEGRTENCIYGFGGYEVRVVVKNIGATASDGFFVELNGIRQFHEGQLLPDQSAVIHFSGAPSNGSGQIHVDASNVVQELNEDNNVGQYIAITPTLPLLCTPTPSPVP